MKDPRDLVLIAEAAAFAIVRHDGQRRRGAADIPYSAHVARVAALTAQAGGTATEVAAAFLHDVVEDTEATQDEIEALFGTDVAALVAALTDDAALADLPTAARKAAQARKIAGAPVEARRIKIADQADNVAGRLEDFALWRPASQAAYLTGCRQVVDACRGASPTLEDRFDAAASALDAKIAEATKEAQP